MCSGIDLLEYHPHNTVINVNNLFKDVLNRSQKEAIWMLVASNFMMNVSNAPLVVNVWKENLCVQDYD